MKSFILVFLLLPACGVVAQGIYEVKYNFSNNPAVEYTALIFYYSQSPDNNLMHIRYYSNNGWNVAEQKVSPIFFKDNGQDYWVLRGKDPTIIDGPEKGKVYTPDWLFLAKTKDAQYYEPKFVSSSNSNSTGDVFGTITSFKVMSKSDITNNYLADFNWKWNDDNHQNFNGTVHVILVSNTNDLTLGSGFDANHRNLVRLFHDIQHTCNLNLDLIELTGNDFNKATVRARIGNLSATNNDVIIFYYSGHGYNDRQSEWPQLDMRQYNSDDLRTNSLSLADDIYSPLLGKNARLLIVIGECCNKYADNSIVSTPIKENPIFLEAGPNTLNASTINALFNKSGRLMLRTSDVGEPSYYARGSGGDFCNNFISSLLSETGFTNTHGDVMWKDIFESAASSTLISSPSTSSKQHIRYFNAIVETP